jgi:two-component system, chemotaxis family, protein-glutamate methylesterase/glutaminase
MATLQGRDIVVVAASAGGLEPLRTLLAGMPPDLPASVLAVLHVPATGGRSLPGILDRAGPLIAAAAVDGERHKPGRVYVAPPDRHLLVVGGMIRLSRGPRQNGLRPAADPLFRSAALYGDSRVIAVVLSGALDDAALGSATVERRGGRVIVQDPEEAAYDSMPRSALATTEHAETLPAAKIAELIARLAREAIEIRPADPDRELELEVAGMLAGDPQTVTNNRRYTGFTCPDCGGPLYHSPEDRTESFDCLVGHKWSPQTLLEEQSTAVERALWLAIRSLDERARLTERLAGKARDQGHTLAAVRFKEATTEAIQAADHIRKVANGMDPVASELDDKKPMPQSPR